MDTKIVVLVNNEKLVLHSYNTTQNVMVQGKNRENFVTYVLEPYFRKQTELSMDKISVFN